MYLIFWKAVPIYRLSLMSFHMTSGRQHLPFGYCDLLVKGEH